MTLLVFFLLALLAAGAIAYPLLPGRTVSQPAAPIGDAEVERAVRSLRKARSHHELLCPGCGHGYHAGDHFCVRCGQALPAPEERAVGLVCPSCGAILHDQDQFCARCGHRLAAEEVV